MGDQALPTLVQLSIWKLLGNQDMTISALEDLPHLLFPKLFLEAFKKKCMRVLKAMVQAWPFSYLPLGALMNIQKDRELLKIALEGLDVLLAQEDRPRKYKLQVLDLRKEHQSFWDVWPQADSTDCEPPPPKKRRTELTESVPKPGEKQVFQVTVNLRLELCDIDETQTHLLEWAKKMQEKGMVQLCCKKLQIWDWCDCAVRESHPYHLLDMMELQQLEELELYYNWSLSSLAIFAFQLGEMRNLHKLFLSHIYIPEKMTPREQTQRIRVFTTHLGKLNRLQTLHMEGVAFLQGNLHKVLGTLKTSLESLLIMECPLSDPDFQYLPVCPNIEQLKHLELNDVTLSCPNALQNLLDKVSSTLEILYLEYCRMLDSMISVILPALSKCTQLTKFSFFGNHFSMPVLKKLIQHTAQMSQLKEELYPVPLESYDEPDAVRAESGSQYCAELMTLIRRFRQPRMVLFGVENCPECDQCCSYDMDCLLACQTDSDSDQE
ncbi:PRAME family member 8-like [Thomomys bottae]